jgi:hypothetical protein
MKFNAKTRRRKATARQSHSQIFLDCGGKRSATPLWKLCPQSKSGVAAALQSSLRFASASCHRSPKSSRRMMIPGDCSAKRFEKLASSGLCAFAFIF